MNKEIAPVLAEINSVLEKHDMTGLVIVGNETHCDWLMKLEASWSCAWSEDLSGGGKVVRIRCKEKDYPSREAAKETLNRTVGNLVTFGHSLSELQGHVEKVLVMIVKNVDFLGKSIDE